MGLHQVANAKGCNGGKDGKANSQPFAVHAAFYGVHGATANVAVGVLDAVAYGKQAFCIAAGNAQYTCGKAPKDCPGAAHGDGCGHAYDVAGAYVGG